MAAGARELRFRAIIDFTELKEDLRGIKDEIVNQAKGIKGAFGGAFAFNQIKQSFDSLLGSASQLIQPFTALDTATAQLRTLGTEAAQIAPSLRDAAIQMSKELPFAAAELQQTMFDALASGVQGGEEGLKSFASTAAKLATGGGSTIGEATTLLAGQLNAYGKSSQEAGAFADIFFNTVNFGVTSIGELSSTLANVIPTAAGAGIELESIGGALAFMTQKGIPTAQSTTKLNQLLIELQKPGAALAPILKAAGVSLQSLKDDDLPTSLEKVKLAIDATGKSAVQLFGSSEAAAAFQSLTGDLEGFRSTFEDVRDTTGSTQNAYAEMSSSIEVRTKQMLSAAQAFVIEGLDAIGSGVVQVASAATQLAPLVTTLAGLKGIIPEGLFTKAATGLKDLLLPMLLKLGIVRTVGVATTAADTAATVANTAAKGAQAVVTGGATTAQYALNTAMLLNPAFLLVAGIGALVAAFLIFGSSTKDLGEATEDAAAAREEFNATIEKTDALNKQASELDKLANEYDKLQGKADPESQKRLAEVSKGIAARTPEATDTVKQLGIQAEQAGDKVDSAGNKIQGTGDKINVTTALVRAQADEMRRLAKESESEALAKLDENAGALGESLREALGEQKKLRDENTKFRSSIESLPQDNPYFKRIGGKIKDNNEDLAELNKKIEAATPELKAQVDTYSKQGFSLDEIAKRLQLSRDILDRFATPDFKTSLVNSEQFKTSIAGMSQEQQKLVNQAVLQGEAYDRARGKVGELQTALDAARAGGDKGQIEEAQKALDAAKEEMKNSQVELTATLNEEETKAALAAVPEQAKGLLKPIQADFALVADQNAINQTQQATNQALLQFNEAKKAALSASGDAEKAQAEKDLATQQGKFQKELGQQATFIGKTKTRLDELRAARAKAADGSAEQKKLNNEITLTESQLKKMALSYNLAAQQGQKFGLVKGDIRQVGQEFKFSGQAANGAAIAVQYIGQKADESAQSVASIGDEFKQLQADAQKASTGFIAEAAGLVLKLREKTLTEAERVEFTKQRDLARARAKEAVKNEKDLNKVLETEQINAGAKERQRQQQRAKNVSRFELEQQKLRDQARAGQIKDELQRQLFEIAARKNQVELEEKLNKKQAQNEYAVSQKTKADKQARDEKIAQSDEKLKLSRIESDQKTNEAIRAAREKLGADILKANDDLTAAELAQRRAAADAITSQEFADLRERKELLTDIFADETDAKVNAQVQADADFQQAVKDGAAVQTQTVVDANQKVAAAEQAVLDKRNELLEKANDRRDELQRSADARRAELTKQKFTEEQILLDEEFRKRTAAIENDPTLAALIASVENDPALQNLNKIANEAGKGLADARGELAARAAEIRRDYIAALTLPADKLTEAQRNILNSLPAATEKTRAALVVSIQNLTAAAGRESAKTIVEIDKQILEAVQRARLASASSTADRTRVQAEIDAEKAKNEELERIAEAERLYLTLRADLANRSAAIMIQFDKELLAARTAEEREEAYARRLVAEEALTAELGTYEDYEERLSALRESRAEAEARSAKAIRDANEKYLSETNALYALSFGIRDALLETFSDKQFLEDQKRRKDAQTSVRQEERQLLDSLRAREGVVRDSLKRLAELRRQAGKDQQSDEDRLWEALRQAGLAAAAKFADKVREINTRVTDAYISQWDTVQKKRLKGETATAEELEKVSDGFLGILGSTAATAIATFAQVAAEGESLGKAALLALVDATIVFLNAMIPVWIAAAYGKTFATLGPVGLAVAGGLVAVITTLGQVAKNALRQAQGLKGGKVAIDGPGTETSDSIPAWLSRNESVINAAGTMAGGSGEMGNRALLKYVNESRKPWWTFPGFAATLERAASAGPKGLPDLLAARAARVSTAHLTAVAEQSLRANDRSQAAAIAALSASVDSMSAKLDTLEELRGQKGRDRAGLKKLGAIADATERAARQRPPKGGHTW